MNFSGQVLFLYAYAYGFHQGMNIHESSLYWGFFQMLPTPGFEEQTRAQIGQDCSKSLIRFVENDPLAGNFATFLNRATVFVTLKVWAKEEYFHAARREGISFSINRELGMWFILPFQ